AARRAVPGVRARARRRHEWGCIVKRNPIKDQVAIVGVGTTGFARTSDRSALALALDASTKAIRDAGLTAADIDGVVAIAEPGAPGPDKLATSLGLTDV